MSVGLKFSSRVREQSLRGMQLVRQRLHKRGVRRLPVRHALGSSLRDRTTDELFEHIAYYADHAIKAARLGHRERLFYLAGLWHGMLVMENKSDEVEEARWADTSNQTRVEFDVRYVKHPDVQT